MTDAVLANGGKTGHPPGLLQDDCRKLSKWLASRMNARQEVREACALIAQEKTMSDKPTEQTVTDALRLAAKSAAPYGTAMIGASHLNEAADTIDTLLAQLAELSAENERLREQRNRVGLYIDRALNGGKKDDHEAGLSGRMDAIRALVAERDEALNLLDTMFSSYENGTACYEDPEDCSGFVGYAFKMDDVDFNACCDLLNRTRPRAAIDAAKGE